MQKVEILVSANAHLEQDRNVSIEINTKYTWCNKNVTLYFSNGDWCDVNLKSYNETSRYLTNYETVYAKDAFVEELKAGNIIIHTDPWRNTRVFTKVQEIPFGYFVWAIGRQNFPFEMCVPLAKQGNDGENSVDVDTLKFIEVESEELALCLLKEAVMHGCDKDKFTKLITNN